MSNSIKQKILSYLTEKRNWAAGGTLEDYIRQTDGHKASNASRRCRELEDDGMIESRYINVPGVANKVVEYRIRQQSGDAPQYKNKATKFGVSPDCCYSYRYFKTHTKDCPVYEVMESQAKVLVDHRQRELGLLKK